MKNSLTEPDNRVGNADAAFALLLMMGGDAVIQASI
jgi:hypothetical protein